MTKVKICGIHNLETIQTLNEAKPDLVGFVFAPSKRQVNLAEALQMRAMLDPQIETVGVFVNPTLAEVEPIVAAHAISVVQIHGTQDAQLVNAIRNLGVKVTQVLHVGDELAVTPDYIMYDGTQPGSGQTIDWQAVKTSQFPTFLAGGLDAANVETAITTADPDFVDVSSGVESDGQKDNTKIREFIRRARHARNETRTR